MKILLLFALAASPFFGCHSLSPARRNERLVQKAILSRPRAEWRHVFDELLRKGMITPARHKRSLEWLQDEDARLQAHRQSEQAAAEQRARDWAALTPQQRVEWELHSREMLARRQESDGLRRAVERQRSDAAFREIDNYWDNRQRQDEAEKTTRALDDIANEMRWR